MNNKILQELGIKPYANQGAMADILLYKHRNQYALNEKGQLIGLHIEGKEITAQAITELLNQPEAATLQYLHLSNTALQTLRIGSKLSNLLVLDLSDNDQLQHLQFDLALPKLKTLKLPNCRLTLLQLPAGFTQLQTLIAHNNQLSTVSIAGSCPQLRRVELFYNNPLQTLQMPGNLDSLEEVHLSNSDTLQNIPPEIVNQGAEAVAVYYKELASAGVAKLYEAKVLILGEGGAGKTTLLRKLTKGINAPMPTDAESTKGIDIVPHPVVCKDANDVEHDFTMHLWDFGGQEIYHATHQFFLTKRSLYILVTDERKEDTDFNYWLQVIELLSDKSPIIIVQNEKNGRKRELNISGLKARFDNIIHVHSFDLSKDEDSLKKLLYDIKHELSKLPHVGEELPKTWTDIRKQLNDSKTKEPYITRQKYADVCQKYGLDDDQTKRLGEYLHDLGAFLYFQDDKVLKNHVFLDNKWVTKGVYDIFEHADIKAAKGHFDKKMAATIWHSRRYSNMHDELLALMERFELCYEIPDKKGQFIAPQLLPANDPPNVLQWNNDQNLQLRYEYTFMPKGILSRFMVRLHRYIKDAQNDAWRTGVILSRQGAQAKVLETYDARCLHIRGKGDDIKDLMTLIAEEIDNLNEGYANLSFKKMVPCICANCNNQEKPHFYKYNTLLDRKKNPKKNTIECEKSGEDVSVDALLNNIFTDTKPPKEPENTNNPLLTDSQKKTLKQQATQQQFKEVFETLNKLNLDKPDYFTLLGEFSSGVYNSRDSQYANRLIVFIDTL